jgi:hypothetical protein
MACVVHGSQVVTQDVDICAPLALENLRRLCDALKDIHPRFRMARDLRPLPQNPEELDKFQIDLGGTCIRVLDLDTLLIAKQAMNSPKDRQVALELSAIRERLLHPDKK